MDVFLAFALMGVVPELLQQPVPLAIVAIEVDGLVKKLGEDPVWLHHLMRVVADSTRIFFLVDLRLCGFFPHLGLVEPGDAGFTTAGLATRALEHHLVDFHADRAFEVLKLDAESRIRVKVFLTDPISRLT